MIFQLEIAVEFGPDDKDALMRLTSEGNGFLWNVIQEVFSKDVLADPGCAARWVVHLSPERKDGLHTLTVEVPGEVDTSGIPYPHVAASAMVR